MKGSEKQIKWAEDIKQKIQDALPDMSSNILANKAKLFVLGLDDARFWIETARNYTDVPMRLLMHLIGKHGLAIRGSGYSDMAKMDEKTGVITLTWTEIVGYGKEGHHETREKVIA